MVAFVAVSGEVTVTFGTAVATVTEVTPTRIRGMLPKQQTTGPIPVTVEGGPTKLELTGYHFVVLADNPGAP